MNLKMPVGEAGGIFKRYASRLEKLGIKRFEDFLYHFPFRYENYTIISKIESVQAGELVTIQGILVEIENIYTKKWKKIQKAKVRDETGEIEIIWFNQPFILNILKKDDKVSLSGKISSYLGKLVVESPEYEVINQENAYKTIHTGRLVPIYRETYGVSSKWLRRQVYKIIQENRNDLKDYLPQKILNEHDLLDLETAIEQIHFPDSLTNAGKARERLSFDELFLLQLSVKKKKTEWKENLTSHPFLITKYKNQIEQFWSKLPFELTRAQKKAVSEIFKDLGAKNPMNRLLEGDVGSGKTVVAGIAMYLAYLNGFQSVFMIPTDILANQHFQTIDNLLSSLGVKIGFATGSKKQNIQSFDILIGTHAVLSDKINYQKLGLVVVDEQQRFGVEQRAIIRKKGKNPHFLTMTATPIPRTVALTLYGDLDLSILDEMPQGRKKIKTWLVPPEKRKNAYSWIKNQISSEKSQVFIICPFIEESESLKTVKAARKEYEFLKNEIFPDLTVELLHGKLKHGEKEKILKKFKNSKADILVSTPVVEVGIDVTGATIMVIEAAERFGLSQLHQMRGRVGRGGKQSYCLLFTESTREETLERIKVMERINFGAELAELDLKLRGPGEFYGTAQHGIPHLRIASFSDFSLIEKTKKEAENFFPQLKNYPSLLGKIESKNIKQISPD
ncbi:MAG: ATP-dependent DNA helicase RecG [Candidatus Levybacteria bacterium]|nr:ATP-dependent DNA helicase RecG [Candidatus Levybacteria bacterium]